MLPWVLAAECMGPLYEQLGMGDKTEEASVTQVRVKSGF